MKNIESIIETAMAGLNEELVPVLRRVLNDKYNLVINPDLDYKGLCEAVATSKKFSKLDSYMADTKVFFILVGRNPSQSDIILTVNEPIVMTQVHEAYVEYKIISPLIK